MSHDTYLTPFLTHFLEPFPFLEKKNFPFLMINLMKGTRIMLNRVCNILKFSLFCPNAKLHRFSSDFPELPDFIPEFDIFYCKIFVSFIYKNVSNSRWVITITFAKRGCS